MNNKEEIMNAEIPSNNLNIIQNSLSNEISEVIDITNEHEPTVHYSLENFIQEVNVEEVYIDEVVIEKINLRKYTKKQRAKNPEAFFRNNLGGFKYTVKKISELRINNTLSYDKIKNFYDLDSMLLNNTLSDSLNVIKDEKNKPSTSFECRKDEPVFCDVSCIDDSDSKKEVTSEPMIVFSKRIHEECSCSGETSSNVKRQRELDSLDEESNESISSLNEMEIDDVLYSITNNENRVLNHGEEYYINGFDDNNYVSEAVSIDSDEYSVVMMDDNVINNDEDAYESDAYEIDAHELDAHESDAHESDAHELDAHESDAHESDVYESDAHESDVYESNHNESDACEIDASETDASETDASSNIVDYITLDDDDDDDVNIPSTSQLVQHKISETLNLDRFSYIDMPESRLNKIFPGYNKQFFNKFFHFIANSKVSDYVHHPENCNISKITIFDLIKTLLPLQWTNDLIIEHYFMLLIKNCEDKILDLGSFFLDCFSKHGYKKVTQSIKNQNVFDYNKLILPTHLQGNHWALTVVDVHKHNVIYYDSLVTTNYHAELSLLIDYLDIAYNKIKNPNDIDRIEWTIIIGDSPLQNNISDCGIFTCTNARHILFNKPLDYSQEDALLLRQRITYEILFHTLLPTV